MYSCILGGIQYINAPMSTPAKPSAFNFQLIIQLQCTIDPKGMSYIVSNIHLFFLFVCFCFVGFLFCWFFCGCFLGIHVPIKPI